MKIVMVANGMDIGGAETHVLELSTELCRNGHLITVASPFGVYTEELKRRGIKTEKIAAFDGSILSFVQQLETLFIVCKRERPDVLHAHTRPGALASEIVGRILSIPVVVTFHLPYKKRGIRGRSTRRGDFTLAVSEDIKKGLITHFRIPKNDIEIIRNGIDITTFVPSGAINRHIVHVSRLDQDRSKAAELLIAIAPSLARTGLCDGISIVGDGERFGLLQKKKDEVNRQIGYEYIEMLGRRTDIEKILKNRPVFVGVSRAALEAMACECTVILCGNEGYGGILDHAKAESATKKNFCCRNHVEATEARLLRDLKGALSMADENRIELGHRMRNTVENTFQRGKMAEIAGIAYQRAIRRKNAPGIMLCGYYGYGNVGDESALPSIIRKCARAYERVTVMSHHPHKDYRRYGVKCIRRYSLVAFLKNFRKGDILVLGGGNLLQNETSHRSLAYYLLIASLAKLKKGKVALVRGGIGELRGNYAQKAVKILLKNCAYISCRTSDDFKQVKQMGAFQKMKISADAALLSMNERKKIASSPLSSKAYCVIVLKKATFKSLKKKANRLHRFCQKHNIIPVFLAFDNAQDHKTIKKAAAMVEGSVLIQTQNRDKIRQMIADSQIVLTERLHAAYFALLENRPFRILTDTEKNLRHIHYMKRCFANVTQVKNGMGGFSDVPLPLSKGDHARAVAKMICGGKGF